MESMRERMFTEHTALQEEYQQYQLQCSVDAELLRRQADDIEKLKLEKETLEQRLKRRPDSRLSTEKSIASRPGHTKKKSSFRLEQHHNIST